MAGFNDPYWLRFARTGEPPPQEEFVKYLQLLQQIDDVRTRTSQEQDYTCQCDKKNLKGSEVFAKLLDHYVKIGDERVLSALNIVLHALLNAPPCDCQVCIRLLPGNNKFSNLCHCNYEGQRKNFPRMREFALRNSPQVHAPHSYEASGVRLHGGSPTQLSGVSTAHPPYSTSSHLICTCRPQRPSVSGPSSSSNFNIVHELQQYVTPHVVPANGAGGTQPQVSDGPTQIVPQGLALSHSTSTHLTCTYQPQRHALPGTSSFRTLQQQITPDLRNHVPATNGGTRVQSSRGPPSFMQIFPQNRGMTLTYTNAAQLTWRLQTQSTPLPGTSRNLVLHVLQQHTTSHSHLRNYIPGNSGRGAQNQLWSPTQTSQNQTTPPFPDSNLAQLLHALANDKRQSQLSKFSMSVSSTSTSNVHPLHQQITPQLRTNVSTNSSGETRIQLPRGPINVFRQRSVYTNSSQLTCKRPAERPSLPSTVVQTTAQLQNVHADNNEPVSNDSTNNPPKPCVQLMPARTPNIQRIRHPFPSAPNTRPCVRLRISKQLFWRLKMQRITRSRIVRKQEDVRPVHNSNSQSTIPSPRIIPQSSQHRPEKPVLSAFMEHQYHRSEPPVVAALRDHQYYRRDSREPPVLPALMDHQYHRREPPVLPAFMDHEYHRSEPPVLPALVDHQYHRSEPPVLPALMDHEYHRSEPPVLPALMDHEYHRSEPLYPATHNPTCLPSSSSRPLIRPAVLSLLSFSNGNSNRPSSLVRFHSSQQSSQSTVLPKSSETPRPDTITNGSASVSSSSSNLATNENAPKPPRLLLSGDFIQLLRQLKQEPVIWPIPSVFVSSTIRQDQMKSIIETERVFTWLQHNFTVFPDHFIKFSTIFQYYCDPNFPELPAISNARLITLFRKFFGPVIMTKKMNNELYLMNLAHISDLEHLFQIFEGFFSQI